MRLPASSSKLLAPLLAALFLAVLIGIAWRSQHVLEARLPPRIETTDQLAGLAAAISYIEAHGGSVQPVLGTGSMAPYISAAPAGRDPLATVCAYVVTREIAFAALRPGDLCVHRSPHVRNFTVLHLAAEKTAAGWIMTGLHNRAYDSARMTAADFIAVAERAFVWPL